MNYFQLNDTHDKIIHILYAGYVCDYYTEAKAEAKEQFGEDAVKIAEKEFNKNYKPDWRC